jgi:predicted ATPase
VLSACRAEPPYRVAITGGSSSGKSYLTREAEARFPGTCSCLPEVASAVLAERKIDQSNLDATTRESVQIEIYRRQVAQEDNAVTGPMVLCDRGTVDASSYWPRGPESFWEAVASSLEKEFARYRAVIWLESAAAVGRYQTNRIRTESAQESWRHGELLKQLWSAHPQLFVIPAHVDFSRKAREFFAVLESLRTA